ncbi:hypothetical protein PFNF135_02135 [Plasmodium falciparum NF135/5.C10]|uniref:Uncharacterized protein n=2 Tax=Plasmodium falciparum TaxID=5833 RepID=A0A024V9C2_PLAFA|nr:hypothetical protein PFFVO_02013 [Plasmodium falciparum Vietnam Oak-Knoll (FVO)]ETW43598.1 hypothetical protein PFNF135_02135 [Plasmodium falciparum NF135/5.C10]
MVFLLFKHTVLHKMKNGNNIKNCYPIKYKHSYTNNNTFKYYLFKILTLKVFYMNNIKNYDNIKVRKY